jgi:hypothetical protein
MHREETLDEELRRIPEKLSARDAARLLRKLPQAIRSAGHSLELAAGNARLDPAAALCHLVFARRAIVRALTLPKRRRARRAP